MQYITNLNLFYMRFFRLLIIGLLVGTACFAEETRTQSNHTIHANISAPNYHVGIGYSYEWAFAPKWTLLGSAWLKGEWSSPHYNYISPEEKTMIMLLHPTLSAEPRFYYNFKRRESKGRSTAFNSGSYVAATFSCFLPSIYGTHGYYRNFVHYGISPHWGMRRVYKNKLFWEFHAGAIILLSQYETIAGLDINFKFGYVF